MEVSYDEAVSPPLPANIEQEMEKERLGREKEEQEKAERAKRLKEEFSDPNNQWEQDKTKLQELAKQDKSKDAASHRRARQDGQRQGSKS